MRVLGLCVLLGLTSAFIGCSSHNSNEQTGKSAVTRSFKKSLSQIQAGEIARLAILYYQDRPANREIVLEWLKSSNAKIKFESARFGYIDAEVLGSDLKKLVQIALDQNLDKELLFHMDLELTGQNTQGSAMAPEPPQVSPPANTSLTGPVHSAGYGAYVEEFRQSAAADLNTTPDQIAGQGITVAVFDQGIDLSRIDVFQNRIKDYPVSDDRLWHTVDQTLEQLKKAKFSNVGLESQLANKRVASTLRFVDYKTDRDLNGAGVKGESIWIAVYQEAGEWYAKIEPSKDQGFGDPVLDFARAYQLKKPQILNLWTGKYLVRNQMDPSSSAIGVKIRTNTDGKLQIALVGSYVGTDHGISNLHMVGGDYESGKDSYHGVAPRVSFLAMGPWILGEYGETWVPLARSILQAVDEGADVLDLDIGAPGTRDSNDLLSALLCRITRTTNVVPVIASHNYGPLPDTIQDLSQSPCVLGIGAFHTLAAMRDAFKEAVPSPDLKNDTDPQVAEYSGRGFGMNGTLKPDIISPAYGYTAYGARFIRFNGTSGATPTTAGSIALLKQAARKLGTELNFDQVRFLLQGSSGTEHLTSPRDGFGFLNLQAAWTLFKSLKATSHLRPLDLTGQKRFSFVGRPQAKSIVVTVTRNAVEGDIDDAVPMNFWIEYSNPKDSKWLKFYDATQKGPSDQLEKDIPEFGNSATIQMQIVMDDAAWNDLSVGEHIAIIKGVRKSLAGKSRAVDYAIPVVITKPLDVDESSIPIQPLYQEQYQILELATLPGERVFLSGQFQCAGDTPNPIDNEEPDAPHLVVFNEPVNSYPDGSFVMNTYAPIRFSSTPITVTAHSTLTRVAVIRLTPGRCNSAISGNVIVRTTGVHVTSPSIIFQRVGQSVHFVANTTLNVNDDADTVHSGIIRGTQSDLKIESATWIVRKRVNQSAVVRVPPGTSRIQVIPDNPNRFVGSLSELNSDGKQVSSSNTINSNFGGFQAPDAKLDGQYTGLELVNPSAGDSVIYFPEMPNGKYDATLEMEIPGPAANSFTLKTTRLVTGPNKIEIDGIFSPNSDPNLAPFNPDSWSAELRIHLSDTESLFNGTHDVHSVGMTLWRGQLAIPVNRD